MALWIPKRLVETSLINTAAENTHSFVTHCEIEYESRVVAAAHEIVAQKKQIIMLTGPSSSGKTTTAHKLAQTLNAEGHTAVVVSLDNFFKNIDEYPRLPDGSKDYENVTALDVKSINTCLNTLLEQGTAEFPEFDFLTETRKKETITVTLPENGVCIVEGIHALNPQLTQMVRPEKVFKIYAGLREEYSFKGQRILPTRDIRLARRMVRDYKFRGHSLEKTIGMWPLVCEGEDKYIKVFKPEADLLLDTSFSYEICVLAPFVESLSEVLPADSAYKPLLDDLIQRFSLCAPISADLIPKNSMLREFIG
ncbi:MAG: nucleoside kinase [Oscillospiraceae bacterium]|nr:nucleoside kinase [Oscillospiraceae bacterium]